MKYFTLIFVTAISLTACKKSELKKSMQGDWELAAVTNMSGYKPYSPGNGNVLSFKSSSRYSRKENNVEVSKGDYSLENRTSCSKKETFISLSDGYFNGLVVNIVEDSLLIFGNSSCVSDGTTTIYRVK